MKRVIGPMLVVGAILALPPAASARPSERPPAAKTAMMSFERPLQGAAEPAALTRLAFWDTARKIFRCAAGIIVFVGGNYLAITKLKKAGGVWKVAKRVWQAKGKKGKIKVLVSVFAEMAGLNDVAQACGA